MWLNKLTSVILFLIISHFNGFAQNRMIQFQNLSYEEGLSDNRIAKILQDQDGFMWFTTRLGIDRYNGTSAKTYQLPNDHIEVSDMIQDKDGRIWIATATGLLVLNQETDTFEQWSPTNTINNGLLSTYISAILDLDGNGIICTTSNGAVIAVSYENATAEVIHQIDTMDKGDTRSDYGSSLYMDNNCTVWIGTRYGRLLQFKNSEFTNMQLKDNFSYITSMAMDQNDQLWIGTSGNGLFKYNVGTHVISHHINSTANKLQGINNNFILDIKVDKKNNVWIGTDGGGLNLYVQADNEFTSFQHNNSNEFPIADNSILDIFLGSDNVIWLGTVHGGVSYFKNHITIRHVPPADIGFEHKDKQSSRILEASNGDIWFTAGRNGLRRYEPKSDKVSVFLDNPNNDRDLSGNNVLDLFEDRHNRIWIGTFNGGLNVYDTKTETFLIPEDPLCAKSIFALAGDDDGNIWVGTDTGIKVYAPDLRLKDYYNTDNVHNLNSNMITALYRDVKGDMWVGTVFGLYVFKNDTVISYISNQQDLSTISGNRIVSITEDDDLSVLIGTYGNGLNRFIRSTNTFQRIGKKDGLEGNIVYGVSVDADKNIWCSTNLGLSKINTDGSIENYNIRYGVQSFQGGSAIVSSNGYIIMGNSLGLSYFKASELKYNPSGPYKVFFTKSSILNNEGMREISISSKINNHITLFPKDNLISIYFSNSNYSSPKKSIYSYILEGLNSEWQNIGNQQVLTFSNLSPGDYTLKVSSDGNPGFENISTATMEITVLPSFFQKAWVKFLVGLGAALLLILFFKWRISSIEKQRERLQLLVGVKTEEIKKEQEKVYQGEIALLKVEKNNQFLNQQKLKEELDFKTGELTNYTLRTIHKNDLLTEIKDHLLVETKEKQPNKSNLTKIISLIEDSLKLDEDWENFYNLFNQIHTTFIKDLKDYCPKLTDREIRLCALIKLNFNSQHIATLFGISLSSVKVSRHRLRKKLNIASDNTYEDFFETL